VTLWLFAVVDRSSTGPPPGDPPSPPATSPPHAVAPPGGAVALTLEKRKAIYQLYCIRSDLIFRDWFEAQPPGERSAWMAKTPEDQAATKELWVGLNNARICEAVASKLSVHSPIHLTAGEVSGIAYEGRDQHWPERP
jgi:hypothetical protein